MWSAVLAPSTQGVADAKTIVRWQHDSVRVKHIAHILRAHPGEIPRGPLGSYAWELLGVYRRLEEVTSARVIVDSSVRPSDGALLRLLPDVDAYFVHLIRDPRAVVFSRSQVKANPDRAIAAEMPGIRPPVAAVHWNAVNIAAEAVGRKVDPSRFLRIRYEDFVSDPVSTVQRLTELVREQPESIPVNSDGEVYLNVNHTASGNPSRFQTGVVRVRRDNRWLNSMSRNDYLLTTAITLPLLLRYRYPIHGR